MAPENSRSRNACLARGKLAAGAQWRASCTVERVKKLALILLALGFSALGADFAAGLAAYNRGDYATAIHEWQPIAERGDPHAQYNLGLLYARGHGVPQDYRQAADWYRKAAEQEVPAAQYNLGVMYANGQGVQRNSQEAAKWFVRAAQHGVVRAELGAARMYAEGDAGSRNYAEAEQWYRKAAEHGIASAAFELAMLYDLGLGVPQNYTEALKWYHRAGDEGYASALTNIGILYYNAQGVKRSMIQAYAWIARGKKLGDPRATQLVAVCAERMQPGDIKKARLLADQWHPSNQPQMPAVDASRLFKPRPVEPVRDAAPGAHNADRTVGPAGATLPAGTKQPVWHAQPESVLRPPEPANSIPAGMPVQPDEWKDVDRVVAVGDVHGDYEQFVLVLQSAGLIDGNGNWIGGKTHLVQTGDVVDRGPDSRAVMDLLMKLQKQAAAAGGAVHCLLGNSEAMDMYGDLRYVSPAEFAAYAKGGPIAASRTGGGRDHPPGFEEHRAAFGATGEYGRWLRSHNAAIVIDRTLFVHAGLGPKYADWPLEKINNEVRGELNDFALLHGGIDTDREGPLWYDGLAQGNETQIEPLVDSLLRHFDVDRIVVGHTYAGAAITPRFGGKVILIDIGISRAFDNNGAVGCLEIDRGHAYALHRGQGLELPKDENGPDMLRYLQQAAALDPQPSPLRQKIEELQRKLSGTAVGS